MSVPHYPVTIFWYTVLIFIKFCWFEKKMDQF